MEDLFVPVALFAMVAYIFVGLGKLIADSRIRRKLIETGASPELAAAMIAPPAPESRVDPMLRWGIVLGVLGLGFIVLQVLPYTEEDPITTGLLLVSVAAGFLISHAVSRERKALPNPGPNTPHALPAP